MTSLRSANMNDITSIWLSLSGSTAANRPNGIACRWHRRSGLFKVTTKTS